MQKSKKIKIFFSPYLTEEQTVSKWEKNLSVPDAVQLIELAKIFKVSVGELLDVEVEDKNNTTQIAEELAKANEQIAELLENERRWKEANRIRGSILFVTFLAILLSFIIKQEIVAMASTMILLITALVILYRNLGVLTIITTKDMKRKSLQITTAFNIGMIILAVCGALLIEMDIVHLGERQEEYFAAMVITVVIFFAGYISPKLPFNRHTGLRLPWTVQDEETWNVAHQIMGVISIPAGVVYLVLLPIINSFEGLTAAIVFVWIGIPGILSLIYYYKKYHG